MGHWMIYLYIINSKMYLPGQTQTRFDKPSEDKHLIQNGECLSYKEQ